MDRSKSGLAKAITQTNVGDFRNSAPIERRAAYVQQVGHLLAGLAIVDQLSGIVDLLKCEHGFPAKVHTPPQHCSLVVGAGVRVAVFHVLRFDTEI